MVIPEKDSTENEERECVVGAFPNKTVDQITDNFHRWKCCYVPANLKPVLVVSGELDMVGRLVLGTAMWALKRIGHGISVIDT